MVEFDEFKRKLPSYTIATIDELKKPEASKLSIRQKALPFEFPLNIEDKIDVALVMEKFKRQSFYSSVSAPQFGIMKCLIVFTRPRSETEDLCRTKVFLNPSYEKVGDEMAEEVECCVSVKSVAAPVPRYTRIHFRAYDIKGELHEGEVSGVTARLIQHEVDHLDGKLFIDLVSPEKLMSVRDYIDSLKSQHAQSQNVQSECSDFEEIL